MKLSCKENGYIDIQLTLVIVGILLLVGLVHLITYPEYSLKHPSLILYPGVAAVFTIFAFGYYSNMSSLKYPESPFNKHVSPLFIAIQIIGALAYAIWKINKSPYHHLLFVFGAAIVAAIFISVYLENIRTKTEEKNKQKPDTSRLGQREADTAMSEARLAFKKKEYDKVVQIPELHLNILPESQRKRYEIATKHIKK